jgi:hypothetical protein
MPEVFRPIPSLGQIGEVDWHDAAVFQHPAALGRQLEPSNEVDLRRLRAEVVADPAGPVEEVRIVPGEAEEDEGALHHGLLHEVNERGEADRVAPVVFFGEDERLVGGERTMQLHDPGDSGRRDLRRRPDDVVGSPEHVDLRALQQGVPVRRENICPGQ